MTCCNRCYYGVKIDGVPSIEELNASPGYPSSVVRNRPLAYIECVEEIPCNPCASACPQNAITLEKGLTSLPEINPDLCTGCGVCIAACPGLAIYVKAREYDQGLSSIMFPYEYYPLPEVGDEVDLVNRFGDEVCRGTVLSVKLSQKYDRTAVVKVSFPQAYFNEVVSMKRLPVKNM